jgi:signal transduction histidine kinase
MEKLSINQVLSEITNDLVGQFDLNDLLKKIVEMVMRLLNAEVCSIFLDDKESKPLTIKMLAGSGFASRLVDKAKYEIGEGFTGYVYKTGKKFRFNSPEELKNLTNEETGKRIWMGKHDQEQWIDIGYKFRNLIILPLKIKDEIFGVIKVENKKDHDVFSLDDEIIFEIIANVVSLAIENARLYQKLEIQLKSISAKAAHRINNQATNYDGVEYELGLELSKPIIDKDNIKSIKTRLKNTTENLKSMINEFKRFGKPLELNKIRCNLNKIISNEIWYAQPNPQKLRIEDNLDKNLPDINIDEGRFAEAIKELLRNSIKAIEKANTKFGIIKIYTIFNDEQKKIIFRIEDNGPGFPKDFAVFEPFSTTDRESTGLGLFTVKELVERHGGTIKKLDFENGAIIEFVLDISKN